MSICPKCAKEYDDLLPNCPFCDLSAENIPVVSEPSDLIADLDSLLSPEEEKAAEEKPKREAKGIVSAPPMVSAPQSAPESKKKSVLAVIITVVAVLIIGIAAAVLIFSSANRAKGDAATASDSDTAVAAAENTTAQEVTESDTQPGTTVPETTQPQTTVPVTEAEPEKPVVPTTGVGVLKGAVGNVEQVVFYPNKMLSDSKKYPVVAFANGTGCSYTLYEELLKCVAEKGYIVVANSERMAADGTEQIASIDFVIEESKNSSSVLYNKVNTSQIGAFGHSQGGRSSVNAAAQDSRIKCVISLAGSNFDYEAQLLKTPAFFITGTKDKIVDSETWVEMDYNECKGPAVYASLEGATHTTCCSEPEKYVNYMIDWFDIYLKGETGNKAIFKQGGALSKDDAWVDFKSKGL